MSTTLHNLTNSLTSSQNLLEWVPNQSHFATDNLADILWSSLLVVKTLPVHGLIDRVFNSGSDPGAFWSKCLLVLQRVLE
jgi:hypothetical protein